MKAADDRRPQGFEICRDVAIVGLACRFGGEADNAEGLWKMLCNGRDARSKTDRRRGQGYDAYYLQQDPWVFDTNFFNISNREAKAIDPSHRLLLEVTYEAFENAGLSLADVAGSRTSCYVGQFTTDYREMLFRDVHGAPMHNVTGTNSALAANRLSWFFDLRGPSMTLNTACSSSMLAIHAACESIRNGEADMAVAAGSNMILSRDMFAGFAALNFLAPDGICKAFDAAANGYGRGEGVAAIIIRPVKAAVQAHEPIRAVIRGTGVNHNGRRNPRGITLPSSDAQRQLIEETYCVAGLALDETTYVEAHGTGTKAGDPLELEAIGSTLGQGARKRGRRLFVGSGKPNIGHTEATAGIAAVIKAVLALEKGVIPPNIRFNKPNPNIDFEQNNITIPKSLTPWPSNALRRISACSTGYSGANAHVILDDAFHYLSQQGVTNALHFTQPSPLLYSNNTASFKSKRSSPLQSRLFNIHAQDHDGLARQREGLAQWLRRRRDHDGLRFEEEPLLRDLAFTLNTKRSRLPWTSSVVASSCSDLEHKLLSTPGTITMQDHKALPHWPRICFVFTGQGAQWPRMAFELYSHSKVVRESIEAATRFLKESLKCPWSATEELIRNEATSRIHDPAMSQTLCTVVQVALVDLLSSWGVVPDYIVGHSSGEIAGAYCRGALNKEAAWTVAYYRGYLSSSMISNTTERPPKGGMLAAGSSSEKSEELISKAGVNGKVVVACINSQDSVTLSGDADQIHKLELSLKNEGIFARRLRVNVAYHSPHMARIAADYFRAIHRVQPHNSRATVKMFSAVSGRVVEPWELGPRYFVDNLVCPVRFSTAVEGILEQSTAGGGDIAVDVFLEIGPHSALQGPLRQILSKRPDQTLKYASMLLRNENSVDTALAAAGQLYGLGVDVRFDKINADLSSDNTSPTLLIDTPAYSWDHGTQFKGLSRFAEQQEKHMDYHGALLGARSPDLVDGGHIWRRYIRPSQMKWLFDHEIDRVALFPAAAHLVLALEAAQSFVEVDLSVDSFVLRDIGLHSPLIIPESGDIEITIEMRPHHQASRTRSSALWKEFTVSSCTEGQDLREHCTGLLKLEYEPAVDSAGHRERDLRRKSSQEEYQARAKSCEAGIDDTGFYSSLAAVGVRYGPVFQKLTDIRYNNAECVFRVQPQSWENEAFRITHPGALDAMIHSVFAACTQSGFEVTSPTVPVFIDEVCVSMSACTSGAKPICVGFASAKQHGFSGVMGDVVVFAESSMDPQVEIHGLLLRSTGGSADSSQNQGVSREVCTSLSWETLDEEEGAAEKINKDDNLAIIYAENSSPATIDLAHKVQSALQERGVRSKPQTWTSELSAVNNRRCIFLLDIDESTLAEASAEGFDLLQQAVASCASLLWVSLDTSDGSIVPGFARSLRNENPAITFRTLQISPASLSDLSKLSQNIAQCAQSSGSDMELRESDGDLLVPRLAADEDVNRGLETLLDDGTIVSKELLSQHDYPVNLSVRNPGDISSLCFVPRPDLKGRQPKPDEVEIEVHASGLNFREVLVAMGTITDTVFGFDACGTITAVGSGVDRFKIGDTVCTLYHGAHSSRIVNKAILTQAVPQGLNPDQACTLPLTCATAYNALVRVARAEAGQTVLIHAGSGGVGQTAIQLAQHLGLQIFTTVGSQQKRELLQRQYGIPDDHIFSSRDTSFVQGIMRVSSGRGVDIVLNSLAKELLRQSWNCLAPFGTFVEIGLSDIQDNFGLDMRPFAKDATFSFFNLSHMMEQCPHIVGRLLDGAFDLLRQGVLRPVLPLTSFPVASVESAFRKMQSGKHMGKLALVWPTQAPIPMLIKKRSQHRLRRDATYVLAGGLGGLGRSIAHLLVNMGARYICFLSRSGAKSDVAKRTVTELQNLGVSVSVCAVDLADKPSLQQALSQVTRENPPIRGVVQCAMVLRDVIFEKMTLQQWRESLSPKVQGSRNLDELLGDVDFFIMLSSFAGIFGNLTQSNYAAGCAFQDALAHERRARGQGASVAIDLGIMRQVGYLAEHGSTGHLQQWESEFGLDETTLHSLLRMAVGNELPAQIVTGLPSEAAARSANGSRPFYLDDPKFTSLTDRGSQGQRNAFGTSSGLQSDLSKCASPEEARHIITSAMLKKVASCLQIVESNIDTARPLHSYGVDSLVAVEIRTWIFHQLKANLSVFDLTVSTPIKGLIERITKLSEALPQACRV